MFFGGRECIDICTRGSLRATVKFSKPWLPVIHRNRTRWDNWDLASSREFQRSTNSDSR